MIKVLEKKFRKFLINERGYSNFTVDSYMIDLFQFFSYLDSNGVNNIRDVNKDVIRGFLENLYKNGISNKTLRRKLSCLRTFFKYLRRENIINGNPTYSVPQPRFHKRLPKFLTITQIFNAIDNIKCEKTLDVRNKAILLHIFPVVLISRPY